MPARPLYQVVGAVEVQAALGRLGRDAASVEGARKAAAPVLAGALEDVPRVSGDLASTLRIVDDEGGAAVVAGSGWVPYAGVINYGWDARGIAAQPFLTGSAERGVPDVVDAWADHIGDLVARFDRETPG